MALLVAAPSGAQAQTPPTATAQPIAAAIRKLASPDPVVAAEADLVLFDAGRAAVVPLIRALDSRRRPVAARAASLLGRIGDLRAVVPLERALADGLDADERLAVAVALLRLGAKSGIGALIELLESGDREVRLRASLALGRFTHLDFGFRFDAAGAERAAAVRRWREWWAANERDFEPRR